MTTLLTSELIDRCHAGSRNKGFWDIKPDERQQLMLTVSELAEALEAHRKGRKVTCHWRHFAPMAASMADEHDGARDLFVTTIKDTPADELADAFIRGCDFAAGFDLMPDTLNGYTDDRYNHVNNAEHIWPVPENFGAALYAITDLLTKVSANGGRRMDGYVLGRALAAIQRLAEREGIDLATHIDLKLRYNATRPAKHGKAY